MNSKLFTNSLTETYPKKTDVILLAHHLLGTVRGKSVNGLIIHNELFNVVAIVDKNAVGQLTSEICQGVNKNVPVYPSTEIAGRLHDAKALVILCEPKEYWHSDIKTGIKLKMDIINTTFDFIKDNHPIKTYIHFHDVRFFDLRDVTELKAYPTDKILKRNARVIYVTGTDCGLGKRTAAFELLKEAKSRNINATMLATGQTGLMLGEQGTVVDSLVIEFSNGIISQQVHQLCEIGYELIFVEGQSDIYHPANSAMALAILHGANPDGIIIVHDERRKYHQGFEENTSLYKMHELQQYIKAFEILSLPCGPEYKTLGIATMGQNNINNINKLLNYEYPVEDTLTEKGAKILLNEILRKCPLYTKNESVTIS